MDDDELLRDVEWAIAEAERRGGTDAPPYGPTLLVQETAADLINNRQIVGLSLRYLRVIASALRRLQDAERQKGV